MFSALLLLTLCLHAMTCPRWLTRAWVVNYGGGSDTTTPRGTLPVTPGAGDGGYGSGSSPGNPPPEAALGTGPPTRQEGVYTPTAHAGAPGRGDGPGSPPWEGISPGGGRGPHAGVGRWRYGKGHSHRGTAASLAPGTNGTVARGFPPLPPLESSSVRGVDRQHALPNRGARGAGSAAGGGDGEPAPEPADPSAQPERGTDHGTGRQRVPPDRGALGVGCATAEGDSGAMPAPTRAGAQTILAQPCLSFGFARRVVCVCACVCAVSLCTCRAFLLVASRP